METSVFEAKCDNCKWNMCLLVEQALTNLSETHMMETGHTVQITEIR